MPNYDFLCPHCKTMVTLHMTNWQHATADHLCRECGVGWLERRPSAPSFVVNGFSNKNGYSK